MTDVLAAGRNDSRLTNWPWPSPAGIKRCPISGCGEQINPSRLMCRRDWKLVPTHTYGPDVGHMAVRPGSVEL